MSVLSHSISLTKSAGRALGFRRYLFAQSHFGADAYVLKALMSNTIYNNNQSLNAFQYNMGGALATINWLQKVDN